MATACAVTSFFGQGAGLVRADSRDRAERLHHWQMLDDGIPPRHALDADGERDREDRRQALGYGGDRKGDGSQNISPRPQPWTSTPNAKVSAARARIAAVSQRANRAIWRSSGVVRARPARAVR
jgi:hypothetical protein